MKVAFIILEFSIVLFIVYLIVTQIMWPAVRGTMLFPMFRKEQKIRNDMLDLNQKMQEMELADAYEQRRREYFGTSTEEETDMAQAAAIAKKAGSKEPFNDEQWTKTQPIKVDIKLDEEPK